MIRFLSGVLVGGIAGLIVGWVGCLAINTVNLGNPPWYRGR
jgi:hypothetical protein